MPKKDVNKILEEKTFGMKNKGKSKKIQVRGSCCVCPSVGSRAHSPLTFVSRSITWRQLPRI